MATAAAVGLAVDALRNGGGDHEAPLQVSPEAVSLEAEAAQLVRQAVADLSVAERAVIERYYLKGERMDHIARDMNINKSWVSRLHARAIARLSKRLDRSGLQPGDGSRRQR